MIDTVMVENANPRHPFGAHGGGGGEVPIVPPMAAVANAINDAIGGQDARPADVAAAVARRDRQERRVSSCCASISRARQPAASPVG
jgi:hypothetical protein